MCFPLPSHPQHTAQCGRRGEVLKPLRTCRPHGTQEDAQSMEGLWSHSLNRNQGHSRKIGSLYCKVFLVGPRCLTFMPRVQPNPTRAGSLQEGPCPHGDGGQWCAGVSASMMARSRQQLPYRYKKAILVTQAGWSLSLINSFLKMLIY